MSEAEGELMSARERRLSVRAKLERNAFGLLSEHGSQHDAQRRPARGVELRSPAGAQAAEALALEAVQQREAGGHSIEVHDPQPHSLAEVRVAAAGTHPPIVERGGASVKA